MLPENARKAAHDAVKADMKLEYEHHIFDTEEEVPPPKKAATAMDVLMGGDSSSDDETNAVGARGARDATSAVKKKFDAYLCMPKADRNQRPMEWWEQYGERLCTLSRLARRFLAVPATSVPSERVFSSAGNIVNYKRSRLTPEHVNMLVFLSKNSNECE